MVHGGKPSANSKTAAMTANDTDLNEHDTRSRRTGKVSRANLSVMGAPEPEPQPESRREYFLHIFSRVWCSHQQLTAIRAAKAAALAHPGEDHLIPKSTDSTDKLVFDSVDTETIT